MLKKLSHIAFVFSFCLLLVLPLIGQFTGISDMILKSSEKRQLAQFPSKKGREIKEYISNINAWYMDHFGFRNIMMRSYSKLKYEGFKVSPLPQRMIQGKVGWLYNNDKRAIYAATQGPAYTENELQALGHFFAQKQAWLAARDIKFYIAIAPSKFSACKKHLPSYLQTQGATAPLDQLEDYLKRKDLPFLNLQKGFPEGKDACTYYRKADTHWNMLGAYWGATHLLKGIQKDFPQISLPELDQFNQIQQTIYTGDQGMLLNLPIQEELIVLKHKGKAGYKVGKKKRPVPERYAFLPNLYEHRFVSTRAYKTGLKVMVYHDSYGLPFQKFLSKCFDEVVFFRIDKFMQDWDENLIRQEAPDILIFERAEHGLGSEIETN